MWPSVTSQSYGFSIGTAQNFAMAPTQGCRLSNGSIENYFNSPSSGAVVIAIGVVAVRVRASYQCPGGYAGGPGGTRDGVAPSAAVARVVRGCAGAARICVCGDKGAARNNATSKAFSATAFSVTYPAIEFEGL